MCKIITISNFKGGTAKSTTCINLGIGLAREGYKVLLVDNDSQGSMSIGLGILNPIELKDTLSEQLMDLLNEESNIDYHRGILSHEEGVDFIAANARLADMERIIQNVEDGEWLLSKYLNKLRDFYDYILIDCHPAMNYTNLNALCCADSVLIPVAPAYLDARGTEMVMEQIAKTKRWLNPGLEVEGILFTRMNERTKIARDTIEAITEAYGGHIRIFENKIPVSVSLQECTIEGCSIYHYKRRCKAAIAYRNFTREVLGYE